MLLDHSQVVFSVACDFRLRFQKVGNVSEFAGYIFSKAEKTQKMLKSPAFSKITLGGKENARFCNKCRAVTSINVPINKFVMKSVVRSCLIILNDEDCPRFDSA